MSLKQFLPEGESSVLLHGRLNSLGMFRTRSQRRRQVALRLAALAGVGVGVPAASAGTFTFNKTTGGTFGWNNTAADGTTASTNWTLNSGSGAFPNAIGDVANLTANITADTTVNLNVPITVGVINLSDGDKLYNVVANGGSLTLNNSGAGAQINVSGAVTPGHSITSGITLADNLVVTQTVNVAGQGITLNGTISADSGARTITLSSLNIAQYTGSVGNVAINSDLTNGGAGGTLSLAQKIGAGTAQGITTLSGNNTYSGSTTVTIGTLKGVQTTGTPFGTGTLALEGGILAVAPAALGGDISLSGASATVGTTVDYAGGATIATSFGSNNSLTFALGNAGAAANTVLNRVGQGTLVIRPTAIANLGVPTSTPGSERLIVNGGVALVSGGLMVSPTIVGQATSASAIGDYLTYGADGLASASGNYTTRGSTFSPAVGEISNITASVSVGAGTPLAIRTSGSFTATINAATTVTVGTGSGPAGILLNGGSIAGSNATSSVLDFGAREAAVYTGASSTISAKMNTTGGLTKFGPSTLTVSNVNNTVSGGVRLNNGTLALTDGAVLGPAKQTLTLMPETTLDLQNGGLDGDTLQHDIVLNGARTATSSNYNSDEPVILTAGSSLATARLLSGIISSGTTATTSGTGGLTIKNGWTRLSGNNTFTGELRAHAAVVIAESNNAFGATTGQRTDGIQNYVGTTIGVRGGVTITNEFEQLNNSSANTSTMGGLHAFPNLDPLGSQVATWTGPITFPADALMGADAGTTLRVTGSLTGSNSFHKVGAGTVEIASNNQGLMGTSTGTTNPVQVRGGTLRVTNTAGSALGGSVVDVQNGATFGGNGSVGNAVLVRAGGTLTPGTDTIGTLSLVAISTANITGYPLSGNLTTEVGAHAAFRLSSTAVDQVKLTATGKIATLASPLEYSAPAGFAPAANASFDLILADSISYDSVAAGGDIPGGYDNLGTLLATYGYTTQVPNTNATLNAGEYKYYIANNAVNLSGVTVDSLRLQVGTVPEPSSALGAALFGGIGLLRRRRQSS